MLGGGGDVVTVDLPGQEEHIFLGGIRQLGVVVVSDSKLTPDSLIMRN
jgi:hypothetical protein